MEKTNDDGTPKKISRHGQLKNTHHEMFRLCEVYLRDCLVAINENRIDPHVIDSLNKTKELYRLIQETKEKQ